MEKIYVGNFTCEVCGKKKYFMMTGMSDGKAEALKCHMTPEYVKKRFTIGLLRQGLEKEVTVQSSL